MEANMLKQVILRYAENIDALRDFVYSINDLIEEFPSRVIRQENPELAESIDTFISAVGDQFDENETSAELMQILDHGVRVDRTSDEAGQIINFNFDDVKGIEAYKSSVMRTE